MFDLEVDASAYNNLIRVGFCEVEVIIDDRLPYSRHGRLLCSYSSNNNEFWVSMLEKAYMKVMGGYDFPGSNSNIDLHALTGWIPQRCAIRNGESDFNADALYDTIQSRLARGDVLVTVATGDLTDAQAERTGLVATHAYAVLDVVCVNGVKLLKLKNPWSHLRWRGNYSELDTVHWTPQLRGQLNYDPDSAAQYDNGVFWIDYASILNFFDVFYLNWNPEIFGFTYCIHQKWDAGTGPVKDAYNIGENPQFSLHVQGKGAVWLLLTRHITQIEDFRNNQEYITLLVYKTGGRRVYYPYEPAPYIDGVRINSPHYLCKIIVSENSADKYTLVVSQYEKSRTIFYTLRAYATCPFTMEKIEPYRYTKTIRGEWSGRNAGGCENHRATYPNNPKYVVTVPDSRVPCHITVQLKGPKQYQIGMEGYVFYAGGCENHRATYPNNPKYVVTVPDSRVPCHITVQLKGPKQYQIGKEGYVFYAGGCENHRATYPNNPKYVVTVPDSRVPCHITVQLKGPKQYQIGFDVRVESLDDPSQTAPFLKESSGPYRSGFVVLELTNLPAGKYIITVSTFYPEQEGPFILELRSTCDIGCESRN
ncbi:calpain family cysteine protease domain-containing protein [Phthorimaea operculella]|nr:calpain family cysteine protease domain-containing protein [Phthorimaea operculella]